MNERDLWWKIVVVGSLVAMAIASVYPMDEKMKFGIDLYGGYSLLYEIDDTGLEGGDRMQLAENVMKVLRERVDPKGVFNLVWRPIGHNRLEIQMPRPSEGVRNARQTAEVLQEQIRDTVLRRSDVLRAFARTGEERDRLVASLIGGIESRRELFAQTGAAFDAWRSMKDQYDARVKQYEATNVPEAAVREAISKAAVERPAAIEALIRGIESRRELLNAAAAAYDTYQTTVAASQPSTQPADREKELAVAKKAYDDAVAKVVATNTDVNKLTDGASIDQVLALEDALNDRIADLLGTNPDLGRLQAILESKRGEAFRTREQQAFLEQYPSLAEAVTKLIEASDALRETRRGEGRLEDPADLQRLLRGAGVLEFRILPEKGTDPAQFERYREELTRRGPRPLPGETNYQWFELEDPLEFLKAKSMEELHRDFDRFRDNASVVVDRYGDKYYVLSHIAEEYVLTHRAGEDWSLKGARPDRDRNGRPAIGFTLDERGGSKFAVLTRQNKDKLLAIFLDDQAVSYATIRSTIRTSGIIEGNFTPLEVQDMVKKLNAGSLPKKLKDPPISIRSIGPSLGEANREAGLRSALYGAIAVVVFMFGYYFYAGGIAVVAVALNILFTLATMAAMGATLTLPGIAGLVLALGMAVDANVLINERIREELQKGTAVRMTVRLGYERAFSAILDSNVTTIITCVILYWLGSEEIKGFGLTLGIGVFINVFTAYFITRMFFDLMVMVSVPSEVVRKPIYAALAIGAFGAALYGLGHWWNAPELREQSALMGFGKVIMIFTPAIFGVYLLMYLGRLIHSRYQKFVKPTIPMMRLFSAPKVDWIGKRAGFLGATGVLVVGGLLIFFATPKKELFDIEFLGGTAAQVDLREDSEIARLPKITDRQARITEDLGRAADSLKASAEAITRAQVTGDKGVYTIATPGIAAKRLEPIIRSVMEGDLSVDVRAPITADDPLAEQVTIHTKTEAGITREMMQERVVRDFPRRFREAGENVAAAQVQAVQAMGSIGGEGMSFEIVTRETSKQTVENAIVDQLESQIRIQPALGFRLARDASGGGRPYFPIRTESVRELGIAVADSEAVNVDLKGWQGGVAMVLEDIKPAQEIGTLTGRLRAMRLQPGFEGFGWRESAVFGLTPAEPGSNQYSRVLVVVIDENYPMLDEQGGLSFAWERDLAEKEVDLLQQALQRQTSLSQVTQFDRQVSGEAQLDAVLALVLSWLAIILYVWARFGDARWGFAAVFALVCDVVVAVGCIVAAHYIEGTAIGRALLIDKFRIDLSVVAAVLTIVGYSVNDKIVVFDRIRENRGRLNTLTAKMVNDSISQVLPRTFLTGVTALATIFIMYVFGGPGIHAFNFVLFIGIVFGTLSSIGVASQLLLRRRERLEAA